MDEQLALQLVKETYIKYKISGDKDDKYAWEMAVLNYAECLRSF